MAAKTLRQKSKLGRPQLFFCLVERQVKAWNGTFTMGTMMLIRDTNHNVDVVGENSDDRPPQWEEHRGGRGVEGGEDQHAPGKG